MNKAVEVNILEQKLIVKSENDKEHVKKVVDYLNSKIEEVKQGSKAVSTLNIALLAAMNIAGTYLETKERLARLEGKSKELSELIDKWVD